MALNLDKIKEQLARMSGGGGKKELWRPEAAPTPGNKYEIRLMPWPDGNDGQPFKERAFYYNIGGGRAILAPFQFSKPDPIQDLITKLRNSEAFEQAKEFYPKRRYYAPVIVRGEEDAGVKLWSFGKKIATELLEKMLGDAGDITDPTEGHDITVKSIQDPGSPWAQTTVDVRFKSTKLGTVKQMKEWLDSVPDLDSIYSLIETDDIKKRVNDHLNGISSSSGTEVNAKADVSSEVTAEEHTSIGDAFEQMEDLVQDNG